jgi:hypothetical protein
MESEDRIWIEFSVTRRVRKEKKKKFLSNGEVSGEKS